MRRHQQYSEVNKQQSRIIDTIMFAGVEYRVINGNMAFVHIQYCCGRQKDGSNITAKSNCTDLVSFAYAIDSMAAGHRVQKWHAKRQIQSKCN